MAVTRKPTGAITQIDPGLYQDSTGGYFTGTSMDNAQYVGDNFAAFNIGKPTPAATPAPAPQPPAAPPPATVTTFDNGPTTTSTQPGVTRKPTGGIAQVDPGQYVDESNQMWTGSKDAPVYGGMWTGAKPTSFASVYPTVTPPRTGSAAPPTTTAPAGRPSIAPTPPPEDVTAPPPGAITRRDVGVPRTGAPTTPTTPNQSSYDAVVEAYRTLLGRDPENADVVNQWIGGTGGDLANITAGIAATSEAQAYAARGQSGQMPTGGRLTDPAFADRFIAWAQQQPGVNPSVINDPNYWKGRFASGDFKDDLAYAFKRMMQPEGPAESGRAGPTAPSSYTYDQALQKVQTAIGRALTPAQIDEAFAKFGGTRTDTFTDAGLAPVIAYFKGAGTGGTGGTTPPPIDVTTYGGPGDGGIYGGNNLQQVGQDEFSKLITGGLGALINSGGSGISPFGNTLRDQILSTLKNGGRYDSGTEALNLETARGAADRARKAESSSVEALLADRGLLGEPGHMSGSYTDALGRIEQNTIAPMMSEAIQKYLINEGNLASGRFDNAISSGSSLANADNQTMLGALTAGTQRQNVLSNIALQSLEQNRLFQQFLATYNLDKAKTMYELQNGQNQSLLLLLQQYLAAANTAAGGYI